MTMIGYKNSRKNLRKSFAISIASFDFMGAIYGYFFCPSVISSIPLNPRSVTGRPKTKSKTIQDEINLYNPLS
jgi:hypothetical protein